MSFAFSHLTPLFLPINLPLNCHLLPESLSVPYDLDVLFYICSTLHISQLQQFQRLRSSNYFFIICSARVNITYWEPPL